MTIGFDDFLKLDLRVAAVVNFAPKKIGKFMSRCLVLGFPDDSGAVVPIHPDHRVPDGGRLF